MVAKINRGASLYGAIIYNLQKVNDNTARIIYGTAWLPMCREHGACHATDPVGVWQLPACQQEYRKASPAYIVEPFFGRPAHGFAIHGTGQEYMQRMGYGNQPYIVYMHEDIDRRHIHIVSTCVNEKGEKIDDAYE